MTLTRDEWRAGFRRLGLVAGGLVAASLLLALIFAAAGATASNAIAAGAGLVGILLVLLGVGAYMKTSPVVRGATPEDRKDAERTAFGLFAFGITFSLIALAIG